ncbi:spindle and centriole-associated protein 1 isoform X2 [Sphaeramia orbicularis]|uniref:Spindle and centriole-associated protein 1 n=1 Tax=Sphaeramia orbicularis TaxID=375764 RepID=A0A672ZI60_9TELE|nr:spindle and centriole-associated protein 1 isoform X2 [Sphaeramia orbicularis]
MSFVRTGRPQHHTKGKKPVRPKKAGAPKGEWVSTVNDLSVHKLTPAELSHRHEIHKSHNKTAAQWELREKALKRRLRHNGSPAPLDQASLSIIREVFSDQLLLQDVLARSDRAMAVVKDLFGDAPRRQTGHPSVTMAPNCDSDLPLPVLQRPDPPTQLSLLSQSMMDQQALNELQTSNEDHSDEDAAGSSDYNVIRRTNIRKMKTRATGKVLQQQTLHPGSRQVDRDSVPVTPPTVGRPPDQTALNATVAVQRVRCSQSQSGEDKQDPSPLVSQVLNYEQLPSQSGRKTRKCVSQSSELNGSSFASLSGDQSSLGLLQSMLGQVEADLDSLSPNTVAASAQSPKHHQTKGLTGFSVALVSTLGRLVHLLKQREDEAQRGAQERRRLEEELREQQRLIDALTAETMALREEAATLQVKLQEQTAELEQKLDTVVLVMGGLGLLETEFNPPQDCDVRAPVCHASPVPGGVETQMSRVSPAVLLSPPQQQNNGPHIPVINPLPGDILRSCEDIKTHSSASSLTSLPCTSSLSLSSEPLSSHMSPEAMLAEIAQLSRQNELMKAQLSQAKSLGSGEGGSPSSWREDRRLSSDSRSIRQNVGEKRMSGSSSTGRHSRQRQHVHAAESEQEAQQAESPSTFSAISVEQRLLELNRQSAAARSRLLELIEQQKQSASTKVSPSASPIPPSAFSPNTEIRSSPDVSMQKQELQAGGGDKGGTLNEVSSFQSVRGEASEGKAKVEKQRVQEGWFALSAHVR